MKLSLPANISKLRKEHAMTQEQLAEHTMSAACADIILLKMLLIMVQQQQQQQSQTAIMTARFIIMEKLLALIQKELFLKMSRAKPQNSLEAARSAIC